jgi:hypothetical protein
VNDADRRAACTLASAALAMDGAADLRGVLEWLPHHQQRCRPRRPRILGQRTSIVPPGPVRRPRTRQTNHPPS